MEDERKKWNKYELDEAMKESKDEFKDLEMQLHELAVKFCLRALETFQKAKSEPLNPLQISQIIGREIEHVIDDISGSEFMDVTIKRTKLEWEKGHHNSKG
jgi:predicted nuclease with TOPRIM domain